MSDRRLTPFSGSVAHESLRGHIEAPAFTAGEAASLIVPVADLKPGGKYVAKDMFEVTE